MSSYSEDAVVSKVFYHKTSSE